jgi:hypothetical protein
MNTNTAITRQLMWTARTLEAERWQVLRGSVSTGAKEDESSTGHIWAAGFHHVTARSRLAGILKLTNSFISLIFQFFGGRSEARVTEMADTESADTRTRVYNHKSK